MHGRRGRYRQARIREKRGRRGLRREKHRAYGMPLSAGNVKGSLAWVQCHELEAQSSMKLQEIMSILCMGKPCEHFTTRKERLLLAIYTVGLQALSGYNNR